MAEEYNVLTTVKHMLGITGDYQNETLMAYIDEVKEYMLNAGVKEEVVESRKAAGIIARGVSDLWNFGGGKLSEYFYQRLGQLAYYEPPEEPEETEETKE